MAAQAAAPRKHCFVTIGATANFNGLITNVLAESFHDSLQGLGYTDLNIQYGKGGGWLFDEALRNRDTKGLRVTGFDFSPDGLTKPMLVARGRKGDAEGVVISHAGSGSILDALRLTVALIVVPNPELLDNHQVELAKELAKQGYVVHGQLQDLPAALEAAERLKKRMKEWPPINSGADPVERGAIGVLDEEMGFVD